MLLPFQETDFFYEWSACTSSNDAPSEFGLFLEASTSLDRSRLSVLIKHDSVAIQSQNFRPTDIPGYIPSVPIPAGEFANIRIEESNDLHTILVNGDPIVTVELRAATDALTAAELSFSLSRRTFDVPVTSEWDYVRFGVIPEPGTLALLLGSGLLLARIRPCTIDSRR